MSKGSVYRSLVRGIVDLLDLFVLRAPKTSAWEYNPSIGVAFGGGYEIVVGGQVGVIFLKRQIGTKVEVARLSFASVGAGIGAQTSLAIPTQVSLKSFPSAGIVRYISDVPDFANPDDFAGFCCLIDFDLAILGGGTGVAMLVGVDPKLEKWIRRYMRHLDDLGKLISYEPEGFWDSVRHTVTFPFDYIVDQAKIAIDMGAILVRLAEGRLFRGVIFMAATNLGGSVGIALTLQFGWLTPI